MEKDKEKKSIFGRLGGNKKKGSCCCSFELEEIPEEDSKNGDESETDSCCKP